MRCLACGSKLHNGEQSCPHCHRSTMPTEEALDGCLLLFLVGGGIWYLSDWLIVWIVLPWTLLIAVLFVLTKRREVLRSGPGTGVDARDPEPLDDAAVGIDSAPPLKMVGSDGRPPPGAV